MPEPRDAIRRMAPYKPPAEGREGKLRLDFNENTVGCSPRVVEFLREAVTAPALTVYPEYSETLEELAAYFGVSRDNFLLTNGTDEAIQVLVNTFVSEDDAVLLVHPSYAMYRFYAEAAGARVRAVNYTSENFDFPLQGLLDAVSSETRAILIANPNNPVGTGISPEAIRKILERAPKAAVLIDEAYYEFSGETVLPWIGQYSNLFVSRTFSKAFGMAAMRCGCIFSSAENVAWMRKAQSPYSVNTLAAQAARIAVRDTEYVNSYVSEVLAARQMTMEGLTRLGIRFVPSRANFVLFHAGERAIEIRDALRSRAVLIRDRSYELAGWVRVTIGNREQIGRFLSELEAIWKR